MYLDDIVIPSSTQEEGLQKLKTVLNTLKDYGLEPKFSKCQFLDSQDFFRKFVPSYAVSAKPLRDMLRSETRFTFGMNSKQFFEDLKRKLTIPPILQLYQQGRRTELHVDASKHGFGSILFQETDDGKLHPVYYMSKKTTPSQENFTSYELEVLAIIKSLKKFRIYLLGTNFKIITDCEAFNKTMAKKGLSAKVALWAMSFEEYDYVTEH